MAVRGVETTEEFFRPQFIHHVLQDSNSEFEQTDDNDEFVPIEKFGENSILKFPEMAKTGEPVVQATFQREYEANT